MRSKRSSCRPNRRFCRSASRVSLRSAAAIASADVGLSKVMPRLSAGRFVSDATTSAMVFNMSLCGCMEAWLI